MELLQEIEYHGLHLEIQTYAIFYHGLCKNLWLTKAVTLFQEMEEKKLDIKSWLMVCETLGNFQPEENFSIVFLQHNDKRALRRRIPKAR